MIPLGFVLGILGQTRLDLLLATLAATISGIVWLRQCPPLLYLFVG